MIFYYYWNIVSFLKYVYVYNTPLYDRIVFFTARIRDVYVLSCPFSIVVCYCRPHLIR